VRTRVAPVIGLAALLLASAAAAQIRGAAPDAGAPPVSVETTLSRTAVWPGDRVTYTIDVRCAPGFDVLADDVTAARLNLDGGEVVSAAQEQRESGGGIARRFTFTLVSYRIDIAEMKTAPLQLRYYARRGGGQSSPAGEVTVPGVVVALRSAIPESESVPAVRIPADLVKAPAYLRYLQPVGLALIAIGIVPVVLLSLDLAGIAGRAWSRTSGRRAARRRQVSLEELRGIEAGADPAGVQAYERLGRVVRDHLQLATGLDVHALTPTEVGTALAAHAPSLPQEQIVSLLAECERACYAAAPPPSERWPDALREAEQILSTRRR
jgi:hypothetical protein